MTRHDTLQCVHEPFGDAYYFGPERLAERYENDPKARKESGYEESTYRTIFDRIARENSEVRLLIFSFVVCSIIYCPFFCCISYLFSLIFNSTSYHHNPVPSSYFCVYSCLHALYHRFLFPFAHSARRTRTIPRSLGSARPSPPNLG